MGREEDLRHMYVCFGDIPPLLSSNIFMADIFLECYRENENDSLSVNETSIKEV